jgi:uncharacterized protein
VIVTNTTKNRLISSRAGFADTFFSRGRGLLGRQRLADDDGLVISGCNSIHMFFMKFAIDVIFVDRQDKVVGLVENIQPWRLSPLFWSACKAIEVPPGTIARTTTTLGDNISML